MLQTNRSPHAADGDTHYSVALSPAELLRSVTEFIHRQRLVIVFVAALVVSLGFIYIFTTPPSYTADAQMIIDTRKVQLFQNQSVFGDVAIDSATVDSQIEILKSENIALSVIKDLRLTEDPEFTGQGFGLVGAIFDGIGYIVDFFGSHEPPSQFSLERKAVAAFAKRLTIKRIGLTYVMNISFRSLNAQKAAQIANAVADAYITDQLEAKYQATRRASIWLQDRLRELRAQASAAEEAVIRYKAQHNIVDTGGRLTTEQQLAEVNSQIVQARAATAEAKARLERIEEIVRMEIPDATVADTLKNDVITRLRQQYLDYAAKEADWSARYGRDHLAAVNLRNQMREIRRSIVDELRRIAETYKSDYEIAKVREESIQKSMNEVVAQSQSTNQAQLTLRDLESTAQTYRALHDNFLQRYMESVQQQSFPITEARLISAASRPLEKSHPKTLLVLALAGIGGIVLGTGIGYLRDISDRVFRTAAQVEALLGVDVIAILPKLASAARDPSGAATETRLAGDLAQERTIGGRTGILRYAADEPFSRFAEAIRSIKVSVDLNSDTKQGKVVGITSALPNEGKSTVAANFAQLVALGGGKVVLVDCDLRNPSLSRAITPNTTSGLLEVLTGAMPPDRALWTDTTTNLKFFPNVAKGRLAHTSDVLSSDAMRNFFDLLRQRFDYVIVDLPPLSPIVDVRSSAHLVDAFVLVIEWGETKIDVVQHALNVARPVYDKLLGTVLNKADMNSFGRYQGYSGKYYHNRYYARYGYVD